MQQQSLTPELRRELSRLSVAEFLAVMSGQPLQVRQDPDTLLSSKQAAHYLSFSLSYLRKLVEQGKGPRMLRMGPRVHRYKIADLDQWRDSMRGGAHVR